MHKFYIRMDGDIFGPYTAKGMVELNVMPDIMVTEDSIDTWQPAANFDFAQLAKQEILERIKSTPTVENLQQDLSIEQKREDLKAKLKNPKQVKITYVSPFDNEVFCPHFLWTDGKNDYDFGIERHLPLYKVLFFKGHIRKRNLGFNQKYKKLF